jgi:hypothetical protein
MPKQQETESGVPVKVPDFYPHPDGVAVAVPVTPESTDAGTTKTGQKATTKET